MVSEICGGRDVSRTSTSLANLEIIRPIGVVSKKVNGARITARSITMCIWRAANQQPSCGAKSQKKLAIATTSDMDNFHGNRVWSFTIIVKPVDNKHWSKTCFTNRSADVSVNVSVRKGNSHTDLAEFCSVRFSHFDLAYSFNCVASCKETFDISLFLPFTRHPETSSIEATAFVSCYAKVWSLLWHTRYGGGGGHGWQ